MRKSTGIGGNIGVSWHGSRGVSRPPISGVNAEQIYSVGHRPRY